MRVLWESLQDRPHGATKSLFVGLDNYVGLFSDHAFGQSVLNNLVYAVGTVPLSMALALLFALALQGSTRINSMLRMLLLFPSMVPLVAAASLFFFIFLPGVGLFDYYLAKLGIRGANWLGESRRGTLVADRHHRVEERGLLHALLPGGPADPVERGARGRHHRRRQRLAASALRDRAAPGATTAFVLVIALINVLTQVDHVIVLTKGGPSNSTKLVLYYIFEQAHENFAYGKACCRSPSCSPSRSSRSRPWNEARMPRVERFGTAGLQARLMSGPGGPWSQEGQDAPR